MKTKLFFAVPLIVFTLKVQSQVNITSGLTACYALDGSGTEPINNLTAILNSVTATADRFGNLNKALNFSGRRE